VSRIDVDDTIKKVEQGELPGWIADHLRAYNESGGREGHLWDSSAAGGKGLLPCLLLHCVGRRSGRAMVHPLIYGRDGDAYVIVGSKGGAETQPGWYFNLLAQPNVTIQVGTEEFQICARVIEGEERKRVWDQMVEIFPPYTDYQAKTQREIPIFMLERT
jgi:deazaflavin-dependent oxidoreductase (nitroreductase family)